jgi:hypothetical protein
MTRQLPSHFGEQTGLRRSSIKTGRTGPPKIERGPPPVVDAEEGGRLALSSFALHHIG